MTFMSVETACNNVFDVSWVSKMETVSKWRGKTWSACLQEVKTYQTAVQTSRNLQIKLKTKDHVEKLIVLYAFFFTCFHSHSVVFLAGPEWVSFPLS